MRVPEGREGGRGQQCWIGEEVNHHYTMHNCCLFFSLPQRGDTSLDDEDIHALQQLYQRITHLCLLHGENTDHLSMGANKVLYQLSGLHFHGIFNKIILR